MVDLIGSLLHIPITVFFWRGSRNFTVFGNEGCFEFFNLLVIFDEFSFNLWNNLISWLSNILLSRRTVDWFWLFSI